MCSVHPLPFWATACSRSGVNHRDSLLFKTESYNFAILAHNYDSSVVVAQATVSFFEEVLFHAKG